MANKTSGKPQPKETPKAAAKSKETFTGIGNGSSLRSRTSTWFECKVRYMKCMEDGSEKTVTELYTVDALSFTEAEARILEEMAAYVSGELRIANINPAHIPRSSSPMFQMMISGSRSASPSSPSTRRPRRRSAPIRPISCSPSPASVPCAT